MKLYSNDFEDGGSLPEKFTCNGEGIMPSLFWAEVPDQAKSLAISLVDPDAPNGEFVHWLIADISTGISGIEAGDIAGREFPNTTGKVEYIPPCPPSGKHKYVFTLFALDIETIGEEAAQAFFDEVRSHMIKKTTLTVFYGKK